MRKASLIVVMAVLTVIAGKCFADTFGSGENQFSIDFVEISGGTNPESGYGIVGYNYRIGTYEITNDQWNKFKADYGTVTGDPSSAYNSDTNWTGNNVPTNMVSWYEAAQFVNWLNASSGYQRAYYFTGTQGTSDYALATWTAAEAWGGDNLYRHKDAHYFLPSEDEWVKAAYWNGSSIQTYATPDGLTPIKDVDANYGVGGGQPWAIGSGAIELHHTFDMMGNVYEWMESPYSDETFGTGSSRVLRGGSCSGTTSQLSFSARDGYNPASEYANIGFRVAAVSVSNECPSADLSGDCFVDIDDLRILAQQWCTGVDIPCPTADISGDCFIDFEDFATMAQQWYGGE